MSKPDQAAGEFSVRLAAHVRDLMAEHGITQMQLAAKMGRSQAFVSERTGGVRPLDTDIMDAIASLIGWPGYHFMAELIRRLEQNGHG